MIKYLSVYKKTILLSNIRSVRYIEKKIFKHKPKAFLLV